MQNVLLIADTSNIKYCLERTFNNGKMNYNKWKEDAVGGDILFAGIAYGRKFGDLQWPFCKTLTHLGFELRFKEALKRGRDESKSEHWVNWNVGIAVDVMTALQNSPGKIDKVILGSSEHELIHLVEYLRGRHIQTEIFACGIPKCLREVASSCRDIDASYLYEAPPAIPADPSF